MPRRISQSELQAYFKDWLDTNFTNGLITSKQRQVRLEELRRGLPVVVAELNRDGRADLPFEGGSKTLTIVPHEGLDPTRGKFTIFALRFSGTPRSRRLTCFVGHRFLPRINKTLRPNLRFVLEPSNIRPVWTDMDMSGEGFFAKTIREIRHADFCIFDNRDADLRPNVYIEVGIAYVLKKPFIIADYKDNRLEVPSDLQHINRVQYRDYEDLCRQIYFRLPVFLRDNRLRGLRYKKASRNP